MTILVCRPLSTNRWSANASGAVSRSMNRSFRTCRSRIVRSRRRKFSLPAFLCYRLEIAQKFCRLVIGSGAAAFDFGLDLAPDAFTPPRYRQEPGLTGFLRPLPSSSRNEPAAGRSRAASQPDAKSDSEIFNKVGPASGAAGVPCVIMTSCPMDSWR